MNRCAEVQGERDKGRGFRPLYLVPCIFALLLSACGFHLRGAVALPEAMARTELRGVDPYGELATEIGAVLADAGAQVVASGEGASAILHISGERFARRVASVDSSGKASQYELRYVLSGVLREPDGGPLAPARDATVVRLLNADSDNALGTSTEEEMLRREMQRDAVRQLIRQLRIALVRAPAAAKVTP
jgi:LPS-assembly lipoprotein